MKSTTGKSLWKAWEEKADCSEKVGDDQDLPGWGGDSIGRKPCRWGEKIGRSERKEKVLGEVRENRADEEKVLG